MSAHQHGESDKPAAPQPALPPAKPQSAPAGIDTIAKLVQALSVVAGVVISVLSFNHAWKKEAEARRAESAKREMEAALPFVKLRQDLYLEAVRAAAILANPDTHTQEDVTNSRQRFRELYVAELSLVEGRGVEGAMKALARAVDPPLLDFTPAQSAAYQLAHALRDSLQRSWGFDKDVVDNP